MLTPQEVSEKVFAKATFGGYNMSQVDEFLDVLTSDYSMLYTDNAVLKSKLKVMVDKVEEYRSTEEAMRKALMSAQRLADETIRSAEEQKQTMLVEAEEMARAKVASIHAERAAEERRLLEAQRTVMAFTAQARATYQRNMEYLEVLESAIPETIAPAEGLTSAQMAKDAMADDIEQNVQRMLEQAVAEVAAAKEQETSPEEQTPAEENATQDEDLDYHDLDLGHDYQIK